LENRNQRVYFAQFEARTIVAAMHAHAPHSIGEWPTRRYPFDAEKRSVLSARILAPSFIMDAQLIRALIRQGEGTQVEFKRTITHLPKIAKTITALANNRGGVILVGVEDNRQIVGVNPEEESFMIMQATRDYIQPALHIDFRQYDYDGHTVLAVLVPESSIKPHQARDKNNVWNTYVRAEDKCLMMDQESVRLLKQIPPPLERDSRSFSHNEQAAFDLVRRQKRITPKDLAKARNLSRQRAEKLLFELVRQGHLFLQKQGPHQWYIAA
jgi:predicted HTH transcriptional regulator